LVPIEADIHRGIVEQCMQGKRQYFHELYKLYSKAMFNVCLRMVGDRLDAEDILQESFADAFVRIKEFRFESFFGAWLRKIVVNKCISHLRKHRIDLEFIEDIEEIETWEEEDSGLSESDSAMIIEKVKKAMHQLPGGSRAIFSLYLFEGYDHLEIAEILKISESTSKSQYMRARQKVKEILILSDYETR
jgi:RNA polymerase sigma factor (sigma-70 family)